jgi:CRISPR-associated protein Cas6
LIKALEQETSQSNQCPSINVSFALNGKQLPADHGYLVYSAISQSFSSLHGVDWLAIELISGFPSGRGLIALPDRNATLRLRVPADQYRNGVQLAGKRRDIGGDKIRLGRNEVRPVADVFGGDRSGVGWPGKVPF